MTATGIEALHLRELSALEAMTHGKGGMQEWHDLCAVVNLCEVTAQTTIGPEALQACKTAQDGLLDAARRFEQTQCMGLTGGALVALRDVVEWHHLQRQSIDRKTYERVIAKTRARIQNKGVGVVEV